MFKNNKIKVKIKKIIHIIVKSIGIKSHIVGFTLSPYSSLNNIKQVKRREAIEKLVTASPKSLSFGFNTWSLEKLSKFFSDVVDHDYSLIQCYHSS